jgi:mannose-6-phosphate isomerase
MPYSLGDLTEPLLLTPALRPLIWGGHALHERYGKGDGAGPVAEAWELSARSEGPSVVARGPHAGASLRALLGDGADCFPLLVKLIDADARLSVQVHPGPEDCRSAALPGAESKDEAWLVLGVREGARIWRGLAPGVDRAAFERALAAGRVEEALHGFTPRVGDLISIPPGTVHAIGAGVLLAEVQESSDTTYRVWDWGRVDRDGRPRPLHVGEALQVIRFDQPALPDRVIEGDGALPRRDLRLLARPSFVLDWCSVEASRALQPEPDRFVAWMLLDGACRLAWGEGAIEEHADITAGQTFLVPAGGWPVTLRPAHGQPVGLLRIMPG